MVAGWLAALMVLVGPSQGWAQETQPAATAFLEAGARLTSVQGELSPILNMSALIGISEGLAVGGGGSILLSDRHVEGGLAFPQQLLGFGYGGLIVEFGTFSLGDVSSLSARALAGAGNADLRDRITGTRIASDNVFLIEPELILGLPLGPKIQARARLSYRHVWSVQDLADLTRSDLAGVALGVSLRLGPL